MRFTIPVLALTAGGIASFLICLAIVRTKNLHGKHTLDSGNGIQKIHNGSTPRVGGLAIFVSILIGWIFVPSAISGLLGATLLASFPCFLSGVAEDLGKRDRVSERLIAALLSGILAWWLTGYSLTRVDIWGLDALLAFPPVSVIFTAFAVAGMTNAINIIDGLNGLASASVLLSLTALGFIALESNDVEMAKICFVVGGATCGFMVVNYPFGRIFLGDGGAYLLGFLLAWIAVMVAARNPQVSPWAPMLACGYPVLEVLFSIVRRRLRARSWGQPDRLHLHSLVWSRVTSKWLKGRSMAAQNAAVMPFVMIYAILPATFSVLLRNSTIGLIAACLFCALVYWIIYVMLLHLRWTTKVRRI